MKYKMPYSEMTEREVFICLNISQRLMREYMRKSTYWRIRACVEHAHKSGYPVKDNFPFLYKTFIA